MHPGGADKKQSRGKRKILPGKNALQEGNEDIVWGEMISQPCDWLHRGDAWNILLTLSYNQSPSHLYVFIFIFWPCLMACRILFPWSRMETVSTAVKAQSPNHWCLVSQSCPTLCDPMDCIARQAPLPVGILQARILEWVAISSSRGSSQPRNRTQVSHIAGRFFTIWATREAP